MKLLRRMAHGARVRKSMLEARRLPRCVDEGRAGLARGAEKLAAGDRAGAEAAFREAVRLDRAAPDACLALGRVLLDAGRADDAFAAFQCALDLSPDPAEPLVGLGKSCLALGRPAEARRYLLSVFDFHREHAGAAAALGADCLEAGRLEEAERWLAQALRLDPNDAGAHCSLGNLRATQGHHQQAIDCYLQALEHAPDFPDPCANIGSVHAARGDHDDAVEWYRRAIALRPDFELAHRNLANTLENQGHAEAAREHYQRACELSGDPGHRVRLAVLMPIIPRAGESIADIRSDLASRLRQAAAEPLAIDDPDTQIGRTSFYLAYHGENDLALQRQHAALYESVCPALRYTAPHCLGGVPDSDRAPIALGFVSRHFHNHTIGHLMRGIIAELDRAQFEVTVFTVAHEPDPVSEFIREHADRIITLAPKLFPAREQIAAEEMDLLYYPDIGMEPLTYFLAFSRLAPVQCTSWGHPVTTGLDTIDYFISSELLETESADAHYCESLVRLPYPPVYFYRPRAADPLPLSHFGLTPGRHIYLCPQSLFKLHPQFDSMLTGVLRADARGEIVLIEGERANWTEIIRSRLQRADPEAAARVRFIPRQPQAKFLGLLAGADVILDPPHFGGGRTTYEALAAGVPVVTWPSEYMRGRPSLACYRQMGMDECVASSPEQYVTLAVRLACDAGYRQEVRQKIAERAGVLFENPAVVRALEAALTASMERAWTGRP